MPDHPPWIIAGLGNPGREYAHTRHNIGFMVVDRMAEKFDIPRCQKKFDNLFGAGEIKGVRVVLATPMAYMNRSGPPLMALARYFKINLDHVLVIHDDIDILFGNLKIKTKGGHGGHNGLKSIIDAAGGNDFPRIRVGIGRPDTHREVTDHVLGNFSEGETRQLDAVVACAAEAAQTIIEKGFTVSMNQFHRKCVGSDNL